MLGLYFTEALWAAMANLVCPECHYLYPTNLPSAYIVMAYIVMAYIVMALYSYGPI